MASGRDALFMRALRVRMKLIIALNKPSIRPVEVRFLDGRVAKKPPDVPQLFERTPLTDVATSLLFSIGGLFIGGELGTLSGARNARKAIEQDEESKRIENAFWRFEADVLKEPAAKLERETGNRGERRRASSDGSEHGS
ncbi:hypothetical protein B0J12DRAFT_279267 [Macrophomina phaseolina]|uniref:Uncharacterized protein n=1 Tax=Macrophomina phaseolina TaxID=35725 RepID=A0ABQ8FXN6_9PEZI|nr:hypothetical protein B0J12DRAFT_279267 [Macrophomina phaseolina]